MDHRALSTFRHPSVRGVHSGWEGCLGAKELVGRSKPHRQGGPRLDDPEGPRGAAVGALVRGGCIPLHCHGQLLNGGRSVPGQGCPERKPGLVSDFPQRVRAHTPEAAQGAKAARAISRLRFHTNMGFSCREGLLVKPETLVLHFPHCRAERALRASSVLKHRDYQ